MGRNRFRWYKSHMDGWEGLAWDLPLGDPPLVVAAGRNAHGFVPKDRYRLPDLWSLHLYGYEAECRVDGTALPIRPGFLGLTPPGATLETRYRGVSVHLYVHFQASGETRRVRAMQDLGTAYDATYERLYAGIARLPHEPRRVAAALWDLLWGLAERPASPSARRTGHAAVRRAEEDIERRLSEPLRVTEIAETAGVSAGYLARLFREAHGTTVVGYLSERRVERAVHLLQRSTLPIKSIAATVGMPDLQRFNKALRARCGMGPRALRGAPIKDDFPV